MEAMTVESRNVNETYAHTAKRIGGALALAAGTATSGYLAMRILKRRHSPWHAARRRAVQWVNERIDTISDELHLASEQREWLQDQVDCTIRGLFRLLKKAKNWGSTRREMLDLIAEKKLLAMKMHVQHHIKFATETEVESLHKFYTELWEQLRSEFRAVLNHP